MHIITLHPVVLMVHPVSNAHAATDHGKLAHASATHEGAVDSEEDQDL